MTYVLMLVPTEMVHRYHQSFIPQISLTIRFFFFCSLSQTSEGTLMGIEMHEEQSLKSTHSP